MLNDVARAVRVTRAALLINRNGRRILISNIGSPPPEIRASLALEKLPDRGGTVDEQSTFMFRLALAEEDMPAIAWLLLGPRPDGTPCNRDERKALEELGDPLANAIATTEARDARYKQLAGLLARHDKRLSAIEVALRSAE